MAPRTRSPEAGNSPPVAPTPGAAWATWAPHALVAVGSALVLFQILLLNDGKLVYVLDDPYIHLAVAENIPRGTYGVNLGEPSAPSSSILYPLLLVPFAGSAILEWMPLAIAFVASLATVALWTRIVGSALAAPGEAQRALLTALVVTLLIPATNLIGVMFTGMEHSLQLFATALLIAGLVAERGGGKEAPWWLWPAIVLGPLVRYENLALSIPALGYLFIRGQRRTALGVLALLGLLVGGFTLFLLSSGHGALPTSVMLKAGLIESQGTVESAVSRVMGNLFQRQGALLAVLVALFAGTALGAKDRRDRQLAGWGAVAVFLHLAVGPFGWFNRYEVYIWSAALLTGIVLFQKPLRSIAASGRPLAVAVGAAGLAFAGGYPYIYTTLKTPLGSNNIYEQQYQMHRFATEFYDGPVAVTDLGWVSFRNDHYVLDLFGLAHRSAVEARLRGDRAYMDELTRQYDVHLAMLYGVWYPDLPERWRPVAELRLGRQRLTPAASVVTFYALDAAAEPRIRSLLREFGETLPPGVGFSILP
jgi:hypothetical protein